MNLSSFPRTLLYLSLNWIVTAHMIALNTTAQVGSTHMIALNTTAQVGSGHMIVLKTTAQVGLAHMIALNTTAQVGSSHGRRRGVDKSRCIPPSPSGK